MYHKYFYATVKILVENSYVCIQFILVEVKQHNPVNKHEIGADCKLVICTTFIKKSFACKWRDNDQRISELCIKSSN